MAFTINVNGTAHSVGVDGDMPLLWVLRDVLGLIGKAGRALPAALSRASYEVRSGLDHVHAWERLLQILGPRNVPDVIRRISRRGANLSETLLHVRSVVFAP